MTQDIAAIARATYDAYVRKDRKALEALIADDFHFSSPIDNRLDRATYFELCWPNSDAIAEFEVVHLVTEGERAFVTYVGKRRDGGRFRNTEVLTVREGQLREAEVYFGWSLPHPAAAGTHLDDAATVTKHP
jgi:ketosteroid isomerase-like protein